MAQRTYKEKFVALFPETETAQAYGGVRALEIKPLSKGQYQARGPNDFAWTGAACCEWRARTQAGRRFYAEMIRNGWIAK